MPKKSYLAWGPVREFFLIDSGIPVFVGYISLMIVFDYFREIFYLLVLFLLPRGKSISSTFAQACVRPCGLTLC